MIRPNKNSRPEGDGETPVNTSTETIRNNAGPSWKWLATLVVVMILIYPLALWLREGGIGGAVNPSLSSADTLLQLSVEHYQAGRYQEALDAAKAALADNPRLAAAYNNMAVSYLRLRMYDEGIEAAQEALRLQPSSELAANNLVLLQQEKAVADSARTEQLMQSGMNQLYTQKNPQAAVEQFRQVLALNPEHYGANYQLAAALQEAGEVDHARLQWIKALDMARAIEDEQTEALILPHLAPADR
jgi:tetratricopeptide (TPR) repeat protein